MEEHQAVRIQILREHGELSLVIVVIPQGGVAAAAIHKAQLVHLIGVFALTLGDQIGHYRLALAELEGQVVLEGNDSLASFVDVAPLAVLLHGCQALIEGGGVLVLGGDELAVGQHAPLRGVLPGGQSAGSQGQGQTERQTRRGHAFGQVFQCTSSFLIS